MPLHKAPLPLLPRRLLLLKLELVLLALPLLRLHLLFDLGFDSLPFEVVGLASCLPRRLPLRPQPLILLQLLRREVKPARILKPQLHLRLLVRDGERLLDVLVEAFLRGALDLALVVPEDVLYF